MSYLFIRMSDDTFMRYRPFPNGKLRIVRQLLNFIMGGFVHVVTKPFASGDRKMTLARTHAAEKEAKKAITEIPVSSNAREKNPVPSILFFLLVFYF
jgi:hypothetical protein